jgi:dGTPase
MSLLHPDPVNAPDHRAAYASHPGASRGRLVQEEASPTRSPFQRDRDRIIHTTAFRRLAHKTQVFVAPKGDHFRTRLTHSIEVAQIARSLARALRLDEDLAEALALAHDLGHTPFGHTGEDALDACMADHGGFDHNAQALRIVTRLERRYAGFDGLNLTWETLEGLVKHNGPLVNRAGQAIGKMATRGVPAAILEYNVRHDLELWSQASLEAQVAAISDDIAYNAADLDDGLRAGLFDVTALRSVPFLAELLAEIEALHLHLESGRLANELMRRIITRFVEDVIAQSRATLERLAPESAAAVRALPEPVIAFSPPMAAAERSIKAFLYPNMYRHASVMPVRADAAKMVSALFSRFVGDVSTMPPEWRAGLEGASPARIARRACDYIAGMTDRYAIEEHRRLG